MTVSRIGVLMGACTLIGAFLTTGTAARQRPPRDSQCVECHRQLDDEALSRPAVDFDSDVHATHGFGCLDCHGPDPTGEGRPNPAAGFLSEPDRRGIVQLCGRCHSNARFMRDYNVARRVDQVAEYETSVHGNRLADANDPNVAICVDCHPAHRIRPPSDNESTVHPLNVAATCGACHSDTVRMESYDITTDQRDKYERSVHWNWLSEEGDLSAATCNDCHGNHGAAPPGVSSVQNVCGQCHTVMASFFSDGPHAEYFGEKGMPGCATCHDNHEVVSTNDEMLERLNDEVCGQCHSEGEIGWSTFRDMKSLIDSLQHGVEESRSVLLEAENLGMEVSQAQFDLDEVTTALVKARTAIHAFAIDSVRQETEAGLTIAARARERGEEALREHLFRRQGLAVSVALILLVIAGIALLIRQLERPHAPMRQ